MTTVRQLAEAIAAPCRKSKTCKLANLKHMYLWCGVGEIEKHLADAGCESAKIRLAEHEACRNETVS